MKSESRNIAAETLALADAAIAACRYLDAVRSVARGSVCRQESTVVNELQAVRNELRSHIDGAVEIADLEALQRIIRPLAKIKIRSAKLARAAVVVCGEKTLHDFEVAPEALAAWLSVLPIAIALAWAARLL
ncbi:MAG: hypothetical protein HYX47_11990 [Burkholderiales bacterium]|nr:hypothetical protein [Burkholderiales bacterium]